MVWSRVRLTSPPPAAVTSKSGSQTSKRAELGLAQGAKEFRKPALRYVDVERFLVMAAYLRGNMGLADVSPRGPLQGRPFAARAALDAVAYGGEELLGPAAQRLPDDRVGLLFPQFGAQRCQHEPPGTKT